LKCRCGEPVSSLFNPTISEAADGSAGINPVLQSQLGEKAALGRSLRAEGTRTCIGTGVGVRLEKHGKASQFVGPDNDAEHYCDAISTLPSSSPSRIIPNPNHNPFAVRYASCSSHRSSLVPPTVPSLWPQVIPSWTNPGRLPVGASDPT
jgi:hypothetical protein